MLLGSIKAFKAASRLPRTRVWQLPNLVWQLPNLVWQLPNLVWQPPNQSLAAAKLSLAAAKLSYMKSVLLGGISANLNSTIRYL